MANTTKPLDVSSKLDNDMIRMPLSNVKVYRGAALTFQRGTGYVKALSTTLLALVSGVNYGVERFVGVCGETFVDNSGGSAGDKYVNVQRKGVFKFAASGITIAHLGRKVWFSDDQTVTLTAPAAGTGGIYAGRIENVDAEGVWVRIDDATVNHIRKVPFAMQPAPLGAAGTNRIKGYQCPAGAKAYLVSASYSYSVKPNFATSAVLILSKLSATVRTTMLNAANKDVNNTTPAVDTPTALTLTATPADLELNAGDQIEASITAVGALTAAGDTHVTGEIIEVGGDNVE